MHRNYLHTAKAPGTHPWAQHILPGSSFVAFAFYDSLSSIAIINLKS